MVKYVKDEITKVLKVKDPSEKTVVIDGKYLLYKQKTVYAKLTSDSTLHFYVRVKAEDAQDAKETFTSKRGELLAKQDVTAEVLHLLDDKIHSPQLGRFIYEGTLPEELFKCIVDTDLDFLIIESVLYRIAHEAIKSNKGRISFITDSLQLNEGELRALMTAFKSISYDNYYKFVLSKTQRRFVNKCYKRHRLFGMYLHMFIPVVIEYKYVYNPLVDDPSEQFFMNSNLMQTAIKNNRKLEVSESLTCYMLTHEEICRALGLKKFMRFTPDFLYRYVVGLLHPELPNFPTKTRNVYVRNSESDIVEGYKASYSEEDFEELLAKLAEDDTNATTEEDKTKVAVTLANLRNYAKIDTLYYAVDRNRRALINIGSAKLDPPVSTDMLYNILLEGKLLGAI